MATATKKMSIFRVLFGSGIDVEEHNLETLSAEDTKNVSPEEMEELRAFGKKHQVKEKSVEKGFNDKETGLRRRYGTQSGNANGKAKRSLDEMTSVLSKKIETEIVKEDSDKDIGR